MGCEVSRERDSGGEGDNLTLGNGRGLRKRGRKGRVDGGCIGSDV